MKTTFVTLVVFLFCYSEVLAQHKWVKINSPIVGKHAVVDFFSADSGYLVIDSSLFFSSNGGTTWTSRPRLIDITTSLHFVNADTGVVIHYHSGKIFHTVNGGISWQESVLIGKDTLNVDLMQFVFQQGTSFGVISNLCYGCQNFKGGLLPYSTNGGIEWHLRETDFFYQAWNFAFKSPKVGIGVFDNGFQMLFLGSTKDSGDHWVRSDSGIARRAGTEVSIASLKNGNWLFSLFDHVSSLFYTSTDDGDSWNYTSSVQGEISSTTFFDSVGFTTDYTYSTSDYGNSWVEEHIPSSHRVFQFSVPSTQVAYCITDSEIFKTDSKNAVTINKLNLRFTLLSNPITSSADFQFEVLKAPEVFELFDLLGRQVLREELSAGQASLHLDMQSYPAGIYFARLGNETVRFIKM